jgi:large subunit ribosomal protein L13
MRTRSFATNEVTKRWFVVDVEGVPLGRAAARIATVLRGKNKPEFTPHADVGDFVVVINADKALLTGMKTERELWRWHTGYLGHLRERTVGQMMATKPDFMMWKAVKGMLPKGPLGRKMLKKLKVYAGAEHPHAAQMPQALDLTKV